MSREMRSCRSRRACSTFVSASVGGSQEKSSTSEGRDAQEMEGVLPEWTAPAPRSHRLPASQILTSAVQGHVAGVAAELTGSDAQAKRLPMRTNVVLPLPLSGAMPIVGRCCCSLDPALLARPSAGDRRQKLSTG